MSSLGRRISVTHGHWKRIIETKHPIMKGKEDLVKATLESSTQVRRSRKDLNVYLYYSQMREKYCCVVARHLNGEGFVITADITDRIKAGDKYEAY